MSETQTLYTKDDGGEYVEHVTPTLYAKDDTGAYSEHVAPTFRDSLSEELRGNEILSGIEDTEALAKTFVDLKSSQPEVPATPDAYKFDVPENFPIDDTEMGGFKALTHKLGMSQDKASELFNYYVEYQNRGVKALQDKKDADLEKAETTLKTDWGSDYEANVGLVDKTVETFGGEELIKEFESLKLTRNPIMMRTFHKIGKAMSEATLAPGGPGPPAERTEVDRTGTGEPVLDFSKSMPDQYR